MLRAVPASEVEDVGLIKNAWIAVGGAEERNNGLAFLDMDAANIERLFGDAPCELIGSVVSKDLVGRIAAANGI